MEPRFRADIEGLRGVAVLAVVLFHAGYKFFAGGFVGVDVFFVISGFLITGLIRREVQSKRFSFREFYIRRTQRLFPAAFVMIAVSFVVAACLYSPQDLRRMGGESVYATVALSNVFYWLQSGYFDTDSIRKPLLHTWSLGVEEQFYLVWPALLVLAMRMRAATVTMVIALVAAASLIACVRMMKHDPTAAFFLTPFRMFEFAIGGILTSLRPLPAAAGKAAFAVGFAVVMCSVLAYSEATPFPGLYALPPAIGTALMIAGGEQGGLARLLTNPLMRWIGRISYSLYLAHWPVAVFATYTAPPEMAALLKPAILAGSFVVALPLFYLIEQRFRSVAPRTATDRIGFMLACALAAVTFLPIAASAWASNGWAWRLAKELRTVSAVPKEDHERYLFSRNAAFATTKFTAEGTNILIVGDSQASDFLNVLVEAGFHQRANVRLFPIETRCGALIVPMEKKADYWTKENVWTVPRPDVAATCQKLQADFEALPEVKTASVIYLASLWYVHTVPYIATTVKSLQAKSTARVVVIGRKTQHRGSIELASAHGRLQGLESYAGDNRMAETDTVNDAIKASLGTGVNFLNIIDHLCPTAKRCHVLTRDGMPILFDQSHFSVDGAKWIGEKMRAELTRVMTGHSPAKPVASICRDGVTFQEAGHWHACEPDGRWLSELSGSVRLDGAEGAKGISIRGFTFGVARRLTISVDGKVAYSGIVEDADLQVGLATPSQLNPLDVRFDFEGPTPFSPRSIGHSNDDRQLNFMLREISLIR